MAWSAVGVSHHEVSAEVIAGFAGRRDAVVAALLAPGGGVTGVLPLVTCNRVEFILETGDVGLAAQAATAAFTATQPDAGSAILRGLTVRSDTDAVRHLFQVAAGLDSLVIGENQIAGQVRHALRIAEPTLTPGLRQLGEAALRTAKTVASRTGLGAIGRSIAAVGLELAGIENWETTRVLLLGTGSYAGVVVADLHRRGCTRTAVHSASGRRAARFAETHQVSPVSDLPAAVAESDLVVACSGNRRLLDAGTLGGHRPVIVDLSGGTDVDPAVRELGVRLLTIDQLAAHAPAQDEAAVAEAQALVEQAVADFLADQRGREAGGTVTALRARVDGLIEAELATASGRYPPETREAIERSLRRLGNALLHQPSTRATAAARAGELDDYRRALATVFGPDQAAGDRS